MNFQAMYPDTKEKRQAGMKMLRARMLAAKERILASGEIKNPKVIADLRTYIAAIKAAQKKYGEI